MNDPSHMTLLPELVAIVSQYSKPRWPEYTEYCNKVRRKEWPELKKKLLSGDEDTIVALREYLSSVTEEPEEDFSQDTWTQTWYEHNLAKAVYGEDVVWWDFPDYQVWLWAQIIVDMGAGSTIMDIDPIDDSQYKSEFDFPIRWVHEFVPQWVNQYDECHDEFTGYYKRE